MALSVVYCDVLINLNEFNISISHEYFRVGQRELFQEELITPHTYFKIPLNSLQQSH